MEPAAPHPYPLHIWPFVGALISAPLLIGILFFWVYLIPVFAIVIGGPVYLIVGAPILLWFLPRYGHHPILIAVLAFAANAALLGACYLGAVIWPESELQDFVPFLMFGLIFAPLWGAAFGVLYGRMIRPGQGAQPS